MWEGAFPQFCLMIFGCNYVIMLLRYDKVNPRSPMPRPKREGWKPITITISEEADMVLRLRAVEQKTELGTLVDALILEGFERASPMKPKPKQQGRRASKA